MVTRSTSLAIRVASIANRAVYPVTECRMFVPPVWPSVPLRWSPASLNCQSHGSPCYSMPHVCTARMAIRTASLATRVASLAARAVYMATHCRTFVPSVWPSVPLRWPPASLHLPTTQFTCLLNAACSYRPHGHPYRFVGHPPARNAMRRLSCNCMFKLKFKRCTARLATNTASLVTVAASLASCGVSMATNACFDTENCTTLLAISRHPDGHLGHTWVNPWVKPRV